MNTHKKKDDKELKTELINSLLKKIDHLKTKTGKNNKKITFDKQKGSHFNSGSKHFS